MYMGANDMHAVCTPKQETVDHVIPELNTKLATDSSQIALWLKICVNQ